jgi:hypothetical protein
MPDIFRSREGALADDDVKTQLTTLGSQTAPGAQLVPGSAAFLKAAYVSFVSSNEAADQWASLFRLEGPGIARGVFNLAGPAGGGSVATGGHAHMQAIRIPINIPVIKGQEILSFAEALGDDMGTYQAGITLQFGDAAGPEGEIKGEITVEGDLTAVDTVVRLTAQGSVPSPSRLTPPDATVIKRIIVAVASDGAADGEVSYLLRVGGDAVKGGEQTFIVGGESYIDVQSGSDSQHVIQKPLILEDLNIEIAPGETLDISAEMVGVDVGSATIVASAQFA